MRINNNANTIHKALSYCKSDGTWGMLTVTLVFVLGILLVGQNPYPIIDDWSYCWSVQQLLSTGTLQWLATFALAIPLIIGGAVASKIFGFSFLLMHNISAMCSVLATAGMFFAIKAWCNRSGIATICAGTLLFNPILVSLSFAFMTDPLGIAFLTWSFWSVASILKNSSTQLQSSLLLLSLVTLGILTRQSFVVLIPGLILCALFLYRTKHRRLAALLLLGAIIQFPLLSLSEQYLLSHVQFSADTLRTKFFINSVLLQWIDKPESFFRDVYFNSAKVMAYAGAFCFPVMVWKIPQVMKYCYPEESTPDSNFLRSAAWGSLLFALLTVLAPLTYCAVIADDWMPYFSLYWNFPEVGWYYGFTPTIGSPTLVMYWTFACTLVGTLCSWATAYSLVAGFYSATRTKNTALLFFLLILLSCFVSQLFFGVVQGSSYNRERYLLPLMVPIMLLFFCDQNYKVEPLPNSSVLVREAPKIKDITAYVASCATLILCVYSFTAAFDYMQFHSARWTAAARLENSGVPVDAIDVGPDYIFSKLPATYAFANPPTKKYSFADNPATGIPPLGPHRDWPVLNETYVLTPENFDPVLFRGYIPIFKQGYWSPWGWRKKYIIVMKKR